MRSHTLRQFLCGMFVAVGSVGCDHPPAAAPPPIVSAPVRVREVLTPAIAKSGEVELEQVKVNRSGIKNRETGEEIADTSISIRIPIKGEKPERTVLQLIELEPVRDDTGKLLSTDEQMKRMDSCSIYLHKLAREQSNTDADSISLHMLLAVPADGAKSIPAIKGKLLHSEAKLGVVDVKDLSEHKNRQIEEASLSKLKLFTDVALVKGRTEVSVHIPPRSYKLIDDWGLISNVGNRRLRNLFEKSSPQGETAVITKDYDGNVTQKAFLRIEFSSLTKSREISFEFKDVALQQH